MAASTGNATTGSEIPPYDGPVGVGAGGLLALSYLLGTFPTALIVARLAGHDPTSEGSGNPGASNVYRLAGAKAGHPGNNKYAVQQAHDAQKAAGQRQPVPPIQAVYQDRDVSHACAEEHDEVEQRHNQSLVRS